MARPTLDLAIAQAARAMDAAFGPVEAKRYLDVITASGASRCFEALRQNYFAYMANAFRISPAFPDNTRSVNDFIDGEFDVDQMLENWGNAIVGPRLWRKSDYYRLFLGIVSEADFRRGIRDALRQGPAYGPGIDVDANFPVTVDAIYGELLGPIAWQIHRRYLTSIAHQVFRERRRRKR